ncbi:MAG: ketoisovalerate oxidoreductase [Clostridia bacterium]|nr:MAG: ketoisovalerate oxidoreductase [Clostridia bacterium]
MVLAGEGGQGVQTVGEVLAEAAYNAGLEAMYLPNFGVEQRGGVSLAYVQVGEEPITAPKFRFADVVVALSHRSVARSARYVNDHTTLVYDSSGEEIDGGAVGQARRILGLPAVQVAREELSPRVFNMVILGAVWALAPAMPLQEVKRAVESHLGYKFAVQPELRELNFRAITRGRELVAARFGG